MRVARLVPMVAPGKEGFVGYMRVMEARAHCVMAGGVRSSAIGPSYERRWQDGGIKRRVLVGVMVIIVLRGLIRQLRRGER